MINTISIKKQQLEKGFFSIGNGAEKVLVMGSCRVAPYLNYLHKIGKYTIYSIDPFNWHWNAKDERVDFITAITAQEQNQELLKMISSVDIFIHEYYANAGMFNVFRDSKSIYDFGMKAAKDIQIPNFNDCFILVHDLVNFDKEVRQCCIQDLNVIGKISEQSRQLIREKVQKGVDKFSSVCLKSDFPEFNDMFLQNYKKKRYFWNFNHVSKEFTLNLFALINGKFLHNHLGADYWGEVSRVDMYDNIFTPLSDLDEGYEFKEKIVPIQLR